MTNEQTRRVVARLLGEAIVGVFFYALFPYMPDFAIVIILLVALVVIWYDRDFPKKTRTSYATALFWLPIILGLSCGVVWKIVPAAVFKWARNAVTYRFDSV
jgi:hypothetical protein